MPEHDTLRRFIFEQLPVQGRHVHLDASWHAIQQHRDYPQPVRRLLGEALAAAALLSAMLKYEGTLSLQIRGGGPVHLLVVQCTSGLHLRGLAHWRGELAEDAGFRQLVGDGQLALTIEQTRQAERYQGIVALEGDSLAASLEGYFARSEQLPTRLWLHAGDGPAAGFLLQTVPGRDPAADAWQHVTVLADTLKPGELGSLSAQELLHRLYHEDDVRLFGAAPVAFRCHCSRERIEATLRGLGAEEVTGILKEQGKVHVDCEFCGRGYDFDAVDVQTLFVPDAQSAHSGARH
ncbi:MAG: Hsp33 family molecular chaperone HslO [Gammaproteobacteria bacterium]|nr:Hsp33 family molecular chaperone HslO [Gammaproteobacteria bacterium]